MENRERANKRTAFLAKYATLLTLVLVIVIFVFATENFRFVDRGNLFNILKQVSILSIVALGVTVAMAANEFDMSTGSVMGLGCVLGMGLIAQQGFAPGIAIVIVLIMGLLVGALNAFVTTFMRIPSIIVTLATQSIVSGFIYMYSGGKSLYGTNPAIYDLLGQRTILGGLPILVIIMVVFIVITYFVLNKTLIGRYIYATGGNEVTARLSGVSTTKYKYIGLMTSGLFAALAGILQAARLGSGQPTAGDTYTMEAISAVFIGMTTIRVGRANVAGTIIGVFLLGVISNGLNLLGWDYFYQDMAKGIIMIAAVAFAASKSELKFFK
jgi:ribose/xylose/arabinose/galactoside ABC-type transport system permease subunit